MGAIAADNPASTGPATTGVVPLVAGIGHLADGHRCVLETERLTKRFGPVLAVDDLSLRIEAGEVLGFLGPNGSGKSTTIGMVLGLIAPTSGAIRIAGQPLAGAPSIVCEHVGSIIETPAFYPYMSGRDNLRAHGMMVGGVPETKIDDLLAKVGLADRARHKYKSYSLGMKQRLGLAATMLTSPALIILDEPTNGLDPAGQREIREIIPHLADEGHAVLLASHMLHEVEQVSDRVLIVRQGRKITEGQVDDLLRRGGYLEVVVPGDDLDHARKLIRPLAGVEQVTQEGGKLVVVAPEELGGTINRTLVASGIYASAISPRRSSLEDLFLEMTLESDPPA